MSRIGLAALVCSTVGSLLLFTSGAQATSLPPDPDNAALLYYQAGFLRPEPAVYAVFWDTLRGGDPNEKVREYLRRGRVREPIVLVEAATRIPRADWGLMYSQGFPLTPPTLHVLADLARLLEVKARTLAADGQYTQAFEACLALLRFAHHIGDDWYVAYATSHTVSMGGLDAIRYTLGRMPPDMKQLNWLKQQLSTVQRTLWRPTYVFAHIAEMQLQFWRTHPDLMEGWREGVPLAIEDKATQGEIQNLTDEEALSRARSSYDEFLQYVLSIIEGEMLPGEKNARIVEEIRRIEDRASHGDLIGFLMDPMKNIGAYYRLHVQETARFNAIMAAIHIYRIKAETGRLPDMLPADLPNDVFSARDFEYSTTVNGFLLRCRAPAVGLSKIWQFEFEVSE